MSRFIKIDKCEDCSYLKTTFDIGLQDRIPCCTLRKFSWRCSKELFKSCPLPELLEWIEIKPDGSNLPKIETTYFCCGTDYALGDWIEICNFKGNKFYGLSLVDNIYEEIPRVDITHYQPLPAPPVTSPGGE
jgi:hypothetical protein